MDRQSAQPPDIPRPTGSYETAAANRSELHLIVGANEPDWFSLERDPRATLLKVGHCRKVWRVSIEDRSYIAKVHEHGQGFRRIWRTLRRVDPAAREARIGFAAEVRGVAACRVLGFSQSLSQARSVVVLEDFRNAASLAAAWRDSDREGRQLLIEAAAKLIGESHNTDFLHRDMHPENIVVASKPGELVRLAFIDLQGASVCSNRLPEEPRLEMLALIDQSFRRLATKADRLRFLRHYLRIRNLTYTHETIRTVLTVIADASRSHAMGLARQRDRRLRQNGKYFSTIRLGDRRRATVVLELERRHVFSEAGTPDRTVDDWRRELAEIRERESKTLAIEKFRAGGNAEGLAWRVFGSPARKAFEDAHRRRHRDEPAELILGFVERRCPMGLIAECWILRPKR